jgi:hypothetical protein
LTAALFNVSEAEKTVKKIFAQTAKYALSYPAALFTSNLLKSIIGWTSRPNFSRKEATYLRHLWDRAMLRGTQSVPPLKMPSIRNTGPETVILTREEVVRIHALATRRAPEDSLPSGNIVNVLGSFGFLNMMTNRNDNALRNFSELYHSRDPVHLTYAFDIGSYRVMHHALYLGNRPHESGQSGTPNGLIIEVINIVDASGNVISFIAPSTLLHFVAKAKQNESPLYCVEYDKIISMNEAYDRATKSLGRFKYNASLNNCENFVSTVLEGTSRNSVDDAVDNYFAVNKQLFGGHLAVGEYYWQVNGQL